MAKISYQSSAPMTVSATTSAADALRELMQVHHVTQAVLAEHADISQKQLSFILNRHAYMSIEVARKLAIATGLSAQWLLQLDFNYRLSQPDNTDYAAVKRFDWAAES